MGVHTTVGSADGETESPSVMPVSAACERGTALADPAGAMTVIRISCLAFVVSCATSPAGPNDDPDLDADAELAAILADPMPDLPTFDADTAETQIAATACTKERYLHVANYSYVGALGCANGVCSNGCWGYQRRTSGFACDYAGSQADFVETRIGENNGPFASYNEIKPLNAHDAAAVANCRAQSGGLPVRTYTVWNGSGWNAEGIPADVKFAEVFGTQREAAPHFWTWFANARGSFSPMANVSPETGITFVGTKETVARLCSATRTEWMSVYFYDPQAAGGSGMADWKREAIIRGMNYCTTH